MTSLESAVSQYETAMALAAPVANPVFMDCHAHLAEALIRLDRTGDAIVILDELEVRAQRVRSSRTLAAARRCRLLMADQDELAGMFAAATAGPTRSPFELARTQLVFGERLRRLGRRTMAREQLEAALATFTALGAKSWARQARRELSASGVRLRRRDQAEPDALTAQERQVAALVAEGKTNRDVGAALFISPKTVELHLSRVYRKLGLRSRAELIRMHAYTDSPAAGAGDEATCGATAPADVAPG
jgi:DNA-binding CsgD family transcriptional regulator